MRDTRFDDLKKHGYYLEFYVCTDEVVQKPDDDDVVRRNIFWFENREEAEDAMEMIEYTLWIMTEFDVGETKSMFSIKTYEELVEDLESNFEFHKSACYPPELAHKDMKDWFDNGKADSCDRIGLEFFNLGKRREYEI